MPYHFWGDDWFQKYGDSLYEAERYIKKYVYKYSGCWLGMKEKYGTIRYEYLFPPYLNWYIYDNNRRLIWSWDTCTLYRWWYKWGRYILSKAVRNAVLRWPDIKDEILEDYEDF